MEFDKLIVPAIIFSVCCCLLIALMILKKKMVEKHRIPDLFVRNIHSLIQLFIIISVLYAAFEVLKYFLNFNPVIRHVYTILVTVCFGWLTIKVIQLISSMLLCYFDIQQQNNLRARQIHTQVRVFKLLCIAFIVIFIIAGILMTFDAVRAQGTSLLASAGLISIIIGLAAQKTMGNFFAGIQIAIAQPIRVDDVVVVENEWGRIEEIHLTFVVVKLWDLRRLIVPITYFTDHTFQNWTQKTADILGTVMLYVDYTMPVQRIRDELDRLLQGNPLWDGKVKVVQVTNATEKTMEIRILTSARDSGSSFDLRCAIREHMLSFIQKNQISALPRIRAEIAEETSGKDFFESPVLPTEPVRAPAPTLDPNPKPMNNPESS